MDWSYAIILTLKITTKYVSFVLTTAYVRWIEWCNDILDLYNLNHLIRPVPTSFQELSAYMPQTSIDKLMMLYR